MKLASVCNTMMIGLEFGYTVERGCSAVVLCIVILNLYPCYGVGGIGFHFRTPLIRINGTLTIPRYIYEVSQSVRLPYIYGLPAATLQQDNTQPNVARNFKPFFLLADYIALLPWSARS